VDAIVTDAQGSFVRDLTKDDFDVLEEGKKQDLTVMSLVDIPIERPDAPLFTPTAIEPDVATNTKEFNGRVFVLVLDDLQTHFAREIAPALTPLAFDPGHPFPHISNLSHNFAVVVRHSVLDDESLDPIRMGQHHAKTNGAAVILHVKSKTRESERFGEVIHDLGIVIERIGELFRIRPVAVSKARVVGRDKVTAIGKPGEERLEHPR